MSLFRTAHARGSLGRRLYLGDALCTSCGSKGMTVGVFVVAIGVDDSCSIAFWVTLGFCTYCNVALSTLGCIAGCDGISLGVELSFCCRVALEKISLS